MASLTVGLTSDLANLLLSDHPRIIGHEEPLINDPPYTDYHLTLSYNRRQSGEFYIPVCMSDVVDTLSTISFDRAGTLDGQIRWLEERTSDSSEIAVKTRSEAQPW
jgi:hypothetical protein